MHTLILAVCFFLVGSAFHTLAQIDAIARSAVGPDSRLEILSARWSTIIIRLAWSFAIFALWLEGELVAVLSAAKITVPTWAAGMIDLHVGAPVAFMAGYLFDSALAFIPGLNHSVPPAIDAPTEAKGA
jgi:hypothetical protein